MKIPERKAADIIERLIEQVERLKIDVTNAMADKIRLQNALQECRAGREYWSEQEKRLRAALKDARNYVEAVALNTPDHKKKRNYRDCVVRIDAALDEPKQRAG